MNDRLREAMAKLPSDKRAELEARLAAKRAGRGPVTIPRRSDLTTYPLSDGQRRILQMALVVPDPAVYNLQRTHHLVGPVDHDRLDAALTAIVNRHESLRARIISVDGEPDQTVEAMVENVVRHHDLTALLVDERLDRAKALALEAAGEPFDLESDDLLRAQLMTLGPDEHVLVLTAHHVACDGWSMAIIERELGLLYRSAGDDEVLPPLTIQASDVTAWEVTRRAEQADQLRYWSDHLEGAEALVLPGSGRSDGEPNQASHQRFVIDADVVARVDDLGRRLKTTPHVVLLAAWCSLLHRLSGQEDLVVCTPTAGRSHPATHDLVGYFNNIVPLRCDLSGTPTFGELVERVRPVVPAAVDNECPSFQAIAGLPEVVSTALTRCLFVVQDTSVPGLELPEIVVSPLDIESNTTDFDLELYARRTDDRLEVLVRHLHRVLTPDEVDVLTSSYLRVIAAAVDEPDLGVERLPIPPVDQLARRATGERSSGPAPRSRLEAELRQIWERILRIKPIAVDDNFFDLGGHSLLAAELMKEIEDRIVDEPLPLAALFAGPTIAELAVLIEGGGWDQSWSSLVPIQPEGSRPPLFFVHAHGGNVIGYHALANHLGPDQPFFGLQAPHGSTSDQPGNLEEIAANYIAEIRTVWTDGPYLVGGWCLGGDIAFEMGQQLREAGDDVALVLMVDNPRPAVTGAGEQLSFGRLLTNRALNRTGMEWVNLWEANPGERGSHLRRRVTDLGERLMVGIESAIDLTPLPAPRSRAYRAELVARHHEKAYQEYLPTPYEGRVAVVRARYQPVGRKPDPTLGWDPVLAGRRDLIEAAGHRIGLLSEPRVGPVSQLIAKALTRALASDRSR